jgi:hypothetical protein
LRMQGLYHRRSRRVIIGKGFAPAIRTMLRFLVCYLRRNASVRPELPEAIWQ